MSRKPKSPQPPSDDNSIVTLATPSEPRPISFDDKLEKRPQGLNLSVEEIEIHLDRLNLYIPVPQRADADEAQVAAHESRYIAWLMGMTWEEIGEAEGIDFRTARRSCWFFLVKQSLIQQIQSRNSHSMARAHNEHDDAYFRALSAALGEKSWVARISAMTAYRKTVGMEGTSVVSVSVDNRKQTVQVAGSGASSFEQAMDRVRRRLNEDNETAAAVGTDGIPAIDAELVPDNGL